MPGKLRVAMEGPTRLYDSGRGGLAEGTYERCARATRFGILRTRAINRAQLGRRGTVGFTCIPRPHDTCGGHSRRAGISKRGTVSRCGVGRAIINGFGKFGGFGRWHGAPFAKVSAHRQTARASAASAYHIVVAELARDAHRFGEHRLHIAMRMLEFPAFGHGGSHLHLVAQIVPHARGRGHLLHGLLVKP